MAKYAYLFVKKVQQNANRNIRILSMSLGCIRNLWEINLPFPRDADVALTFEKIYSIRRLM